MIRDATLKDIPELLELSKEYYEEGNAKKLTLNEDRVVQSLYSGIIDEDKNISVVLEDDRIVGFTHSCITTTMFSLDVVIECDILFVKKEYRKGRIGIKLIKALTKLAKEVEACYVYLGTTSEINTERTVALYSKLGYKLIGKDFRLEV